MIWGTSGSPHDDTSIFFQLSWSKLEATRRSGGFKQLKNDVLFFGYPEWLSAYFREAITIFILMVVLQQCFGLFRIPRSARAFCIFCSNGWWSFGWISAMSQAQIMRDLSVTWATRTLTSRWPGEVKKPVWSREIHFNLLGKPKKFQRRMPDLTIVIAILPVAFTNFCHFTFTVMWLWFYDSITGLLFFVDYTKL